MFTFTTNKRSLGTNTLPLSNFKILVSSIHGVPEYLTIFEIHVNEKIIWSKFVNGDLDITHDLKMTES